MIFDIKTTNLIISEFASPSYVSDITKYYYSSITPHPNSEKMVHNIRTKDEFQDALKKYPIVVVDFYSTHSAESKHIAATFAHAYELDKFKDFRFVKVDIDELKGLAEEVGVSQPATFHMYKNGEKINDLQSEHKEDLIQFLETGL
ncbi:hypothetical protein FVER53590_10677 [Fusarium verticillioides]|nr:hypothetical protein FVER53590_10677 [Fusarium verticillioides]